MRSCWEAWSGARAGARAGRLRSADRGGLAGLLGGIDPNALFGSFMAAIACAVLSCSLALTLSVWGRKSHEVLIITYMIMILWLFGPFLVATIFYSTGVSGLRLLADRAPGMAGGRESLLPCLGAVS